jgi:hypothetical protein
MTARWPSVDATERIVQGDWIITLTTRTAYGAVISTEGRHAKKGQAQANARRALKAAVKSQNKADEKKAAKRLKGGQ